MLQAWDGEVVTDLSFCFIEIEIQIEIQKNS